MRTTIQGAVDIIDADAYFILTGCTAGIIGDDIVSVTQEFQDNGHEVYPIETPGFAGDSNAVGITRYLANDFSFTPVLVIISEPIFRPDDKERIVEQINDMEYAVPPKVVFVADQYEINQALLNEEKR